MSPPSIHERLRSALTSTSGDFCLLLLMLWLLALCRRAAAGLTSFDFTNDLGGAGLGGAGMGVGLLDRDDDNDMDRSTSGDIRLCLLSRDLD